MAEAMTIEKKHPKGLYLLFTVEMWERFSYYGMRAILMLFMVKFLIFTTELAGQLYGWYCGLVYLTPLAGGYLADRYLGQRRSIVIGAIVMAMGEFALMFSGLSMNLDKQVIAIVLTEEQKTAIAANGQLEIDLNGTQSDTVKSIWKDIETSKASIKQQDIVKNKHVAVTMEGGRFLSAPMPKLPNMTVLLFGVGLVLLILGNGFFKPNISTTVGQLYGQNDPRRDGAFTIFYMGINLGALFSPLICGTLGEKFGWHYGFGSAGIGMLAGLLIYFWGQNKYLGEAGKQPGMAKKKGADNQAVAHEPLTREEKNRIAVIFILVFFNIFFWVAFELAGSALTLFADRSTNRMIPFINWEFPASWYQSVNPFLIVVLAPFFSTFWIRLATKGREPSTPAKMGFGLALLAVGMLIMAFASIALGNGGGKVSALWLLGCYLMCTLGELCLSPVGLSMVTKLSPIRFGSLMMGVWFLSSAVANYSSGIFAGQYDKMPLKVFYIIPTVAAGAAAIFLFALSKRLRGWMHGVH